MSEVIRKIQLKRTSDDISSKNTTLSPGEPVVISEYDSSGGCTEYLAIGSATGPDDTTLKSTSTLPLFKAHSKNVIDESVFYNQLGAATNFSVVDINDNHSRVQLIDENSNQLYPYTNAQDVYYGISAGSRISVKNALEQVISDLGDVQSNYAASYNSKGAAKKVNVYNASSSNACYLVGIYGTGETKSASAQDLWGKDLYAATQNTSATYQTGIYFNAATGVMYGAAWNNDYAEYRLTKCEAGECVIEAGDGTLVKSNKKCVPGASIVSDTFGYVIGVEKNSKPIAVSGRVLAYVDCKDKLKVGDTVCSSIGGNVTKMSKLQKILHPECIIGTVSEIPTYKKWGKTDINERVWIKLK